MGRIRPSDQKRCEMLTKVELHRQVTRARLATAARVPLAEGGGVTASLIADLSRQVGVHPHSFRTLFPTDDDLFDAVNDELVAQCEARLRAGIARFALTEAARRCPQVALEEAAVAIAESWPIDRGGILIRAERRARVLRASTDGQAVVAAERRFVGALVEVMTDLMGHLGRRFTWSPTLAVRVILDTFERSFETWLLSGHEEADFSTSPYARRTLPTLFGQLSEPHLFG